MDTRMLASFESSRHFSRRRHDHRSAAVGRMGLAAIGHGAVRQHRLQPAQALGGRHHHPLVARDRAGAFLEVGTRHVERQRHVALLERPLVGQRRGVLLDAAQHHLVLLRGRDLVFARDILRGVDHGVSAERIVREVVEHPILVTGGAAGRRRIGIDNMRAVRDAIAGRDQRGRGEPGFDLLRRRKQAAHAGRAGLIDGRAADLGGADHAHEPGQTVERALLRHRGAEHAEVERRRRYVAFGELGFRDMGAKFNAVQIGKAPLPFGKGRAPIGAVGDFGPISHSGSVYFSRCSGRLDEAEVAVFLHVDVALA